ncbi:hypothetical protein bplSymb_SCF08301P010 [Bathymodiolus platifrons methanotrophic gill symbiont]|uniref:hypothetical protein n=1 Tax=Bathymodiolus platifrons methanotrophic gill symbiont TaxID=113268 RepID=UPI000B421D76|nr:hypothetical protein [Bathymodiolus platifrons methanotrophic gill symbiont]GAW87410.1 hypothetical protein bplSymb_SCF08301P010 [Bathymodiolus platifrons methanotrophic gill symbiont]
MTRETLSKKSKKIAVPDPPVAEKLAVSRILSEEGGVLTESLLLTIMMMKMDVATLVLWYYWRWKIECFFKLVISMACVTAWAIAVDKSK